MRRSRYLWFVTPLIGQVADCISTLLAIHWQGATEGNPLFADLIMSNPAVVVAIKVAFGVAAIYLFRWIERRSDTRSAIIAAVVATIMSWVPVFWNLGGMLMVALE